MNAAQSNNEDEIDELMNDFDTELITPEEIELTDNQGNVSALILEANVHIVDHKITRDKQKEKKSQKKVPQSHGNMKFLYILKKLNFLKAELPTI